MSGHGVTRGCARRGETLVACACGSRDNAGGDL